MGRQKQSIRGRLPAMLDCERSLLSPGLASRACERKGVTADNTSRNELRPHFTLVKLALPSQKILISN
jgi:hypothetical protein